MKGALQQLFCLLVLARERGQVGQCSQAASRLGRFFSKDLFLERQRLLPDLFGARLVAVIIDHTRQGMHRIHHLGVFFAMFLLGKSENLFSDGDRFGPLGISFELVALLLELRNRVLLFRNCIPTQKADQEGQTPNRSHLRHSLSIVSEEGTQTPGREDFEAALLYGNVIGSDELIVTGYSILSNPLLANDANDEH